MLARCCLLGLAGSLLGLLATLHGLARSLLGLLAALHGLARCCLLGLASRLLGLALATNRRGVLLVGVGGGVGVGRRRVGGGVGRLFKETAKQLVQRVAAFANAHELSALASTLAGVLATGLASVLAGDCVHLYI